METAPDTLGIIAGNRTLPLEFARLARAAGVRRLGRVPAAPRDHRPVEGVGAQKISRKCRL